MTQETEQAPIAPIVATSSGQPGSDTAIPRSARPGKGPESSEPSESRYPCRLPIRMTPGERAIIGKKACALNLSISRYLVTSGVGEKQGQPGQAQDPERLRYLQILFQDAADKAKLLLASPLFTPGDELTRDVRARLEESAYLLKALAGELARRLP